MIQSAETRFDGSTLIVRIPMRFRRRGGRNRIVTPDESELTLSSKPSRTARWSRRSRGRGAGRSCPWHPLLHSND
jgi:hypothetical protein